MRATIILHGRRCYADTLRSKELSKGGTVIWYADGVDSERDDWDRHAPSHELRLALASPNDEVRR